MLGTLTIRKALSRDETFTNHPTSLIHHSGSSGSTAPLSPSSSTATTTASISNPTSTPTARATTRRCQSHPLVGAASFGSTGRSKKKDTANTNMCSTTTCCEVCGSLPFNVRALTSSVGGWDDPTSQANNNNSNLALQKSFSEEEPPEIPSTAGFTSKRLERFFQDAEEKCGQHAAREVARLSTQEVKTGRRIGKGGSSSVYEVTGFALLPMISSKYATSPTQSKLRAALVSGEGEADGIRTTSSSLLAPSSKRERYVMKRVSKNLMSQRHHPETSSTANKIVRAAVVNMLLEAQFLRVMNHPNIVRLVAMGESENDNLFLVMTYLPESMENRILFWRRQTQRYKRKLLQRTKGPAYARFTKSLFLSTSYHKKQQYEAHLELRRLLYERVHVAMDVAAAVAFLHSQGVLYRDLKTSNIGFDSEGTVKLFDFGISRFLPSEKAEDGKELEDSFEMSKVGTKMFMAPEIAEKRPYGMKADCYSFGVLLWQFMAMANPRPNLSPYLMEAGESGTSVAFDKIMSTNRQGPRFEFPICSCWPMFLQSLLRRIMQRNPDLRPSMDEIKRKLEVSLEKLWKEIAQDEEAMFGNTAPSSPVSNTNSQIISPASVATREKKKAIPFMFGLNFDRQRTFETELENDF